MTEKIRNFFYCILVLERLEAAHQRNGAGIYSKTLFQKSEIKIPKNGLKKITV